MNLKEVQINPYISVWVAKDWDGMHLFVSKPKLIDNGNENEEWDGCLSQLNYISIFKQMASEITKVWDANHYPQGITFKVTIA